MIQRRHRSRGKTQQKAVKREVMIDLAQVARPLVLVDAAGTATIQIAQTAGVLDRLPKRAWVAKHADRLADIAPEGAHAHHQRQDRVEERRAEQRRHRLVRHQFVKRARSGVHAEQNLPVVEGSKAENERRNA